jgi:para-nitrobenzyl esterase
VATLLATPLAKGLFHHAICESGSAFPPIAPGQKLKDMERVGQTLFAKLGVDKEQDPLAAARALPWQKIMEANAAITPVTAQPVSMWDGTVEGWVLPDTVANIFRRSTECGLLITHDLGELTGGHGDALDNTSLFKRLYEGKLKQSIVYI